MYVSFEELCGCEVHCRDGLMGKVQDVVLSRSAWRMRYAVVNLGTEFSNAHVLLPLTDAEHADVWRRRLGTSLTRRELEWAAPYDEARPLTRRQERLLSQRYGWPSEWIQDAQDAAPSSLRLEPDKPIAEQEQMLEQMLSDGPETQSAARMIGAFSASTGDSRDASLKTLIVDTEDWGVPYLAVQLGATPKPVVLPAHGIKGIDWLHKHIYLAESADRISHGPRYNPQMAARMALMQRLGAFYNKAGSFAAASPTPSDRFGGVSYGQRNLTLTDSCCDPAAGHP